MIALNLKLIPSRAIRVRAPSPLAFGTGAIVVAALVYILRFAVNAPVVDEWDLTFAVFNMSLWDWSFTRLNEHLFITANAAFWLLHKASGLDFRAGMIANLLAHTLASLILINAAKRMQGRS